MHAHMTPDKMLEAWADRISCHYRGERENGSAEVAKSRHEIPEASLAASDTLTRERGTYQCPFNMHDS